MQREGLTFPDVPIVVFRPSVGQYPDLPAIHVHSQAEIDLLDLPEMILILAERSPGIDGTFIEKFLVARKSFPEHWTRVILGAKWANFNGSLFTGIDSKGNLLWLPPKNIGEISIVWMRKSDSQVQQNSDKTLVFTSWDPVCIYPMIGDSTFKSEREIPSIYCVTLSGCRERQERMRKRFYSLHLRFQFVKAVERESGMVNYRTDSNDPYTKGEAACFSSHIKAIRQFLETNDEWGIICEDDVRIHKEFRRLYKEMFENRETHTDCILLSGLIWDEHWDETFCGGKSPEKQNLLRYHNEVFGAQMYAISRNGAKRILQFIDRPFNQTPFWLKTSEQMFMLLTPLIAHPMLAIEEFSSSTLRGESAHRQNQLAFNRYDKRSYLD